jgi:hypothetical protein
MKIYKPYGGFRIPISMSLAASTLTLLLYLFVVVITTPNLAPVTSIRVAFSLNGHILVSSSIGMGIQTFLVIYSRRLPCPISKKKVALGATGTSTAVSAFFSFFSLTAVGCCGLWLYILSLLPGILGASLTGFLITYSNILSAIGLFGIAISILLMLRNIRNTLKQLEPNKTTA